MAPQGLELEKEKIRAGVISAPRAKHGIVPNSFNNVIACLGGGGRRRCGSPRGPGGRNC